MSAAVENEVVSMKFDNTQFEPAVKQSLSTLDRLKAALNFGGPKKTGLEDVQRAANGFSLNPITAATGKVGAGFLTMATVAITALSNIVNRAVNAGVNIAKALTINPAKQGFQEYEATLGSTQTIMAGTGESVDKVTKSLQRLNNYSDTTIYSFADMTKNISMFTNAGLSSQKAADTMIGISNAAAAAGINADAAGRAMYGFGQAMSVGYVMLQDWNQIDQAGLATKGFKNELIQAGLAAGTLVQKGDKVVTANKGTEVSFKNLRNTLQDQWLTSDVLTNTLQKYGDTSTKVGKLAQKNAQNVYTMTQLFGVIQESIGSSWSLTFQNLFGNLKEASTLFTAVYKATAGPNGFITSMGNARNAVLGSFKQMGGRENIINGLTDGFKSFAKIAGTIKKAFTDIFPPITAKRLYELSEGFVELMARMKPSKETLSTISRIFKGVFAALSIGAQFLQAVGAQFVKLFKIIFKGASPLAEFAAKIGDFLVNLDKTIKKGDSFNKFFEKVGQVLKNPIASIAAVAAAFQRFFAVLLKDPFAVFNARWENFKNLFKKKDAGAGGGGGGVPPFLSKLFEIFQKITAAIKPFVDAVKEGFSNLGQAILDGISSGDVSGILDVLNTGIFAVIVFAVKKFLDEGLKFDFGQTGGMIDTIKGTFGALTNALGAMQSNLQAKTLRSLAISVGILVLSIIALSLIDSDKLTKAMAGVGVAMGYLVGAMALLTKVAGSAGFLRIPSIAAGMIALSVAILLLSASVKVLSGLNWEELARGLLGVAALLAMVVGVSKTLGKNSASIAATGLAMIPLAIGLKILASVVGDFAEMSWESLGKGMAALAVALGIIVAAMRTIPKDVAVKAVGLVILGAALKVIASAMSDFGGMSMAEIGKSLLVLAGSLIVLAAALIAMQSSLPGAAALIVAAGALAIMAPAIQAFGQMDMASIGKAMLVLFGSLLLLAAAMIAMEAGIPGAAALLIAAAALQQLVPVMTTLGGMSVGEIAIALGALAGVFILLGVAAIVLGPLVPVIVALSDALFMLGAAMALAGIGALAFGLGIFALASSFAIIAAQGAAGIAVLAGIILLIPQFLTQLALGVVQFIVTLASGTAQIVAAFVQLAGAVLMSIVQLAPQIGAALNAILAVAVALLYTWVPRLANLGTLLIVSLLNAINARISLITTAAINIIVSFLNTIANNIGRVVTAGTNIIIAFIKGVQANQGRVINAAIQMIIAFVNSLANSIRSNQARMNAAGRNLALAIVDGMTGGLASAVGRVVNAARNLALSAYNAAKSALGINSPSKMFTGLGGYSGDGLAIGLDQSGRRVNKSAENMAVGAFNTVKDKMSGINELLATSVNTDPVIKPVLDLTDVSKNASKIGGMFDNNQLSANVSFQQASNISKNQQATDADAISNSEPVTGPTYHYEQTINAPVAPSPIEVYRNTKNLLSMTQKAVDNS